MDGTSVTPDAYTGRVGIPAFGAVGKVIVLRLLSGEAAAPAEWLNDTAAGMECFQRLSRGRFFCGGATPAECLRYTFPVMLCHLGAFLRRPLMSVSNLTRTVWKYRRLFRTDPFKSAIVSNSRLCVALRLSFFQNRSITFNCGL